MKELLDANDAGSYLPSEWYADPEIFERERRHVLQRSWHFAAHTGQLSGVGDRALCEIAGVPVVLVRDAEGEIRGFLNICRHRGHIVALDERRSPNLQCAYHGWTYGLDGCLRGAPRSEHEPAWEPSGIGLVPVQVAMWGPTIWVNVGTDAPSFEEWFEGLPAQAASHGLDIDACGYAFDKTWTIATNWKVFQENATECYHCAPCHPQLSRVIDTDRNMQTLEVPGRYRVYTRIPLRATAVTSRVSAAGSDRVPDYHFHWIFPTTYVQYVSMHTEGSEVATGFDIGTVNVRSVNEIVFRHIGFLPSGLDDETVARRRAEMEADPTVDQDVALCERVQIGHRSGLAQPGRAMPHSEFQLLHLQKLLIEMLAGAERRP